MAPIYHIGCTDSSKPTQHCDMWRPTYPVNKSGFGRHRRFKGSKSITADEWFGGLLLYTVIDHSLALFTSDEGSTTTPTRPVRDILGEHQHQFPLPRERKIIHFFKIGGTQLSNWAKYSLSPIQKIWQGLKRLGDKAFLHTVSAPRSPRFLFGLVMANQKQFDSVYLGTRSKCRIKPTAVNRE